MMQREHGQDYASHLEKSKKLYDKFRSKTNAKDKRKNINSGGFNIQAEDQEQVFLPAMKTPNQHQTSRMNSDLKTGDRSDNSSINNIVGGNILPFTLPTRFGAPT